MRKKFAGRKICGDKNSLGKNSWSRTEQDFVVKNLHGEKLRWESFAEWKIGDEEKTNSKKFALKSHRVKRSRWENGRIENLD